LVKVAACGVNFKDIYQRNGSAPVPLPCTLGREAAGVVAALGSAVTDLRIGDRVAYAPYQGAYADYAVVPADRLVPLPAAITATQAAAALQQGMTAHFLTHSAYPVQAEDRVLIHAAAGGTGLLLVQLAKMRGAYVVGTVSTPAKAALARAAGADAVILYTQDDFVDAVRRLTAGAGVHVVYDAVGQTTVAGSLACLCRRGHLVLFGEASGPVPPLRLAELNARGSLSVTYPTLADYTAERAELLARASAVFGWIASGALRLHIGGTFALCEAAAAHRVLERRATTGKLLLLPDGAAAETPEDAGHA
jgi:NADPH2:quinone reductase